MTVKVLSGTLSNATHEAAYEGANTALLGSEVISFKTAVAGDPGVYTLSELIRGRRGTEWARDSHVVGEPFVLLTEAALTG